MKLQARLLLGIVPAVAVGLLLLGWVVFSELRTSSEAELHRRMEQVVVQTERRTRSFLSTARSNARLFSRSTIVERYIRVDDEEERFELMQPTLLELFASYREAYPDYVEIQLLLPDGYEDTRLAVPGRPNRSEEEASSAFFQALQAAAEPTYAAYLIDPDNGEPVFKIGQKILLKDAGLDPALAERELYGYLVVTTTTKFLYREVLDERIGRSGHFFLADADGTIIAHADSSLVGSTTPLAAAFPVLAPANSHDAETIAERPMTRFGEGLASVTATHLHANLLLVGVLPERELQTASRRLAVAIALVTLLTICLAIAFFWLFLRRLVLLPLASLQRTAVAIGDGRFDDTSKPFAPRADEIGSLELAFRDMNIKLSRSMNDLQGSYSRIHELAYEDSLTGLANRRQFLETLRESVDDAAVDGKRLAVLYLDLDEFKKVNDLLGHDAGDELLVEVSQRLRDCIRRSDTVARMTTALLEHDTESGIQKRIARLGGDEFIALLPDVTTTADAISIGTRVIEHLTRPIELRDQSFVIGTSIGIALFPDHATSADGLVKCADTAMYVVKKESKNGLRVYGHDMRRRLENEARLESDLRHAIERNEFRLAYQPQLGTASARLVGFEALLRWEHPERGTVSPVEFIPVAELTGLIEPIGCWVIDEACRQWAEWMHAGLDPGRVAINVSPRQFALHDVDDIVEDALMRHALPPQALEVEITESCMMEAPTRVIGTLGRLRKRGVRIAMDDFGTGHSSLATLASLPIDTLKIDRGFVTDVHIDKARSSIMTAVLTLASDLGLETLAEGVELEEELAFLREHDCDVVQGYLLSKPLGADDATAWLRLNRVPVRQAS